MNAVRIPQPAGGPWTRPYRLAADKGYSCRRIRHWLRNHKIQAVIPWRADQAQDGRMKFDRDGYRQRSVIECCVGWIKECRRVATRFEKLAVNFLAILKLAIIQRYLRISPSSDRA
jgi:transposase